MFSISSGEDTNLNSRRTLEPPENIPQRSPVENEISKGSFKKIRCNTVFVPKTQCLLSPEKSPSCWQLEVLSQQSGSSLTPPGWLTLFTESLGLEENSNEEEQAGGELYSARPEALTPADKITGSTFCPTLITCQRPPLLTISVLTPSPCL